MTLLIDLMLIAVSNFIEAVAKDVKLLGQIVLLVLLHKSSKIISLPNILISLITFDTGFPLP